MLEHLGHGLQLLGEDPVVVGKLQKLGVEVGILALIAFEVVRALY